MEAKDLMIGDWVHYSMSNGRYEKDIKISNMYGSEVNCEVRNYEIISGTHIVDLTPIPLTEDILKANGFEHTWGTYAWHKEGFFCLHCALHGEPPYSIEIARKRGAGRIKFVHELQHALRLCGLSELANNFVIEKGCK